MTPPRAARRPVFPPATALCLFLPTGPTPAAQDASFDVVAIRRTTTGSPRSGSQRSAAGAYTATNRTVRGLIVDAYEVQGDQIVGGPGWIDSARFDVNARPAAAAPERRIPAMLRAMLAERFGLAAHFQERESRVYFLVKTREAWWPGPRLMAVGYD